MTVKLSQKYQDITYISDVLWHFKSKADYFSGVTVDSNFIKLNVHKPEIDPLFYKRQIGRRPTAIDTSGLNINNFEFQSSKHFDTLDTFHPLELGIEFQKYTSDLNFRGRILVFETQPEESHIKELLFKSTWQVIITKTEGEHEYFTHFQIVPTLFNSGYSVAGEPSIEKKLDQFTCYIWLPDSQTGKPSIVDLEKDTLEVWGRNERNGRYQRLPLHPSPTSIKEYFPQITDASHRDQATQKLYKHIKKTWKEVFDEEIS